MQLSPTALVVNTKSRRGKLFYKKVKFLLKKHNIHVDVSYSIKDSSEIPSTIQALVVKGYKMVIVGGGDGTISSVVDHLAYTDVVLAILPLGTANSFVRTLGLPVDIEGAVKKIAEGKSKIVDLGKVNNDYFANNANIGFSAQVADTVHHNTKKYFGKFGYLVQGLVTFFRFKPFEIEFEQDGKLYTNYAVEVTIANGKHQGGMLVAPEAEVDSNVLFVRIVSGRSKWSLIKYWFLVLIKRAKSNTSIRNIETQEMVIHAEPNQIVNIDGEIATDTPAHISIAKDALRVVI
jgi:YegS/Rv2252/BmrU family lipid kinase